MSQDRGPRTLEASLQIGIPHPTAPLIQWTNGLLAYQKDPEFLYLKGYQPLIPLYFLLKSRGGTFELFLPRFYSVLRGKNKAVATDKNTDLKLQAGDILKALESADRNPHLVFYNDQGELTFEIFRSNFKAINGTVLPFSVRIKRLLPKPYELILNFKEIRPNRPLNPVVFTNQFPPDVQFTDF